MWWAYQHQNGSWHLKRWSGDPRDYTDDVRDNPFVAGPLVDGRVELATYSITNDAIAVNVREWRDLTTGIVWEREVIRYNNIDAENGQATFWTQPR